MASADASTPPEVAPTSVSSISVEEVLPPSDGVSSTPPASIPTTSIEEVQPISHDSSSTPLASAPSTSVEKAVPVSAGTSSTPPSSITLPPKSNPSQCLSGDSSAASTLCVPPNVAGLESVDYIAEAKQLLNKEFSCSASTSLTLDGPTLGRSSLDAQIRILQLKRDLRAANKEAPRRATAGMFKNVCSTDLLFLIDTTGSMCSEIEAAKTQVKSIVSNIEATFLNEAEVRMAVVGYKDHSDSPNIQFLDFTSSPDEVRAFLNTLVAMGGNDSPEDVLGGIRQALNASWKQQTRCIIHIADAPPHGTVLQPPNMGDDYPEPGSEPHGLTYEPLLRQMVDLNINYALLRINGTTDRMALKFFEMYSAGGAEGTLHKQNQYFQDAKDIIATPGSSFRRAGSKRSAKGALLFEEAMLGTAYSALRHLVVRVVTTSASRTAVRASAGRLSRTSEFDGDKKLDPNLAMIEEDEDDPEETQLEKVPPQWTTPGWLDEKLRMEGFSPDVGVHGASTLNDMMTHNDNIKMCITELTINKRSRPFAEGATRVASYARTSASTNRYVVKSFKKTGKRLAHVAEDMQCQALCKAFALEFNALSGEEQAIDFIVTTCLKGRSKEKATSDDECLSLEPFIEGAYVKYNNNCGYVNNDIPDDRFNEVAQAFSHFTYERSKGRFLVSDLQGVGHILTDPAIHTRDPERFKLADTNLGVEGFKFFFSTHECNQICRKLELKSNGLMISSGKYVFRKTWPRMSNTVCCSNKICGKILRLSSAKKSRKFPDCHWCNECWPQLSSSTINYVCTAPGPHHEFQVSRFFYESQGQVVPLECPEHHEGDEQDVRSAGFGCGLWKILRFPTRWRSSSKKKN